MFGLNILCGIYIVGHNFEKALILKSRGCPYNCAVSCGVFATQKQCFMVIRSLGTDKWVLSTSPSQQFTLFKYGFCDS